MAIEFKMPPLGASVEEVSLVRWLVKAGDEIAKGAVVAEAETDKALVDIECPHGGTVSEIVVSEGTSGVRVGSTIAILLAPGEERAEEPAAQALSQGGNRILASPLARRLAAEGGLPLDGVRGSGPGGRIVRCDIEAALAQKPASADDRAHVGSVDSAVAPLLAKESAVFSTSSELLDFDDLPHSSMRRTIAQRLSEAKRTVPHFYLTIDCEIDALLELRKRLNEALPNGSKISLNDFVVKAVALSMREVPTVNASWTESAIRQWRRCDVSIAVATPGGLITPVIRDADIRSIGAVAADSRSLAERARASRLKPEEYQGGGFTVSNLGMYGIRQFAAIVNPPQACILAVGAGEQRPVVRDGQLTVATVMTCTLSVDHRVVDGAVAAEFLSALRESIQQPMRLLA